jgi:hypothetical protein
MKRPVSFRKPVILGVACLMLALSVVLVAGCGTAKTPTTAAPATTVAPSTTAAAAAVNADYKSYTNVEQGFTFQYPQSWELEETSSAEASAGAESVASVQVYDPLGAQDNTGSLVDGLLVNVYELSVVIDSTNLDKIEQDILDLMAELSAQLPDYQELEPLSTDELNGMPGYGVTYTYTQNGITVYGASYFLFNGDQEFQLTFQAAEENSDSAGEIYDIILGSFQPTK